MRTSRSLGRAHKGLPTAPVSSVLPSLWLIADRVAASPAPQASKHVSAAGRSPRCEALQVDAYDVELELTGGPGHFVSRTVMRFSCRYEGASSFADLRANDVRRAVLNGSRIEVGEAWAEGRLALVRALERRPLKSRRASFTPATRAASSDRR